MKKIMKIGLNASVAFAMMFATTVSAVAQETINASNDNMEVKESVQATALANTVQELSSQWAQKDVQNNVAKIEVMNESFVRTDVLKNDATVQNEYWEYIGGTGGPLSESSYQFSPDPLTCPGAGNLCGIRAPMNSTTGEPVLSDELKNRISALDTSEDDVFEKGS